MEKSQNKSRYWHALFTTVIASAVHPFIMAFMNHEPFSMASALEIAKSDTPFFAVFFALFNFGMAWYGNRAEAKKGN